MHESAVGRRRRRAREAAPGRRKPLLIVLGVLLFLLVVVLECTVEVKAEIGFHDVEDEDGEDLEDDLDDGDDGPRGDGLDRLRTGLFRDGSSPVEEVNAAWFDAPERNTMLREDDGVILVNFYSASCGHCQDFAVTWKKVANYAEKSKCKTHLVAINCDEFRDLCSEYKVRAVPYLLGFAKGSVIRKPETAHELDENLQEILRWLSEADKDFDRAVLQPGEGKKVFGGKTASAPGATTATHGEGGDPGENAVDHLGNKLSAKEMLRRDIAAAVRFGLETGVFLGRFELSGDELAAMYAWLNVLRESFPGAHERAQLEKLFRKLKEREDRTKRVLASAEFDAALETWDFAVYTPSQRTKWRAIWYTCRPATLRHVGVHGGYPCALWKLFHTLTVASGAGGASADRTLNAIVGFIRYSFSCNDCRKHFLESNPNPQREILDSARSHGVSPARALTLFIWSEHNAVSKRLNAEDAALGVTESEAALGPSRRAQFLRPSFPRKYQCRSCRLDSSQPKLRRDVGDAAYLASQERSVGPNAVFRDQLLHGSSSKKSLASSSSSLASDSGPAAPVDAEPSSVVWDYDAVYVFLQHTYCFPDDPKLYCQSQDGSGQLSSSAVAFLVFILACGMYAYMRQRPGKSPLIKKT